MLIQLKIQKIYKYPNANAKFNANAKQTKICK